MATTFIAASFFGTAVFIGNIIFDRNMSKHIDWKRTLITTAIAFGLTVLIGVISE